MSASELLSDNTTKRPGSDCASPENAKRLRHTPRSTYREIVDQAYDACEYEVNRSVLYEEHHPNSDAILVPAFVNWNTSAPPARGLPSPNTIMQELLWRWTPGQQINVSAASMKLCSELRMTEDVESGIESELAFTLKRLRDTNASIGKRCLQGTPLQLQVSVHLDELLLRDTVVWDVSQPYTTAEQYAASLCEELGLRFNWYNAIYAHVQQLLQDIREEFDHEGTTMLPLYEAPTSWIAPVKYTSPLEGLPRPQGPLSTPLLPKVLAHRPPKPPPPKAPAPPFDGAPSVQDAAVVRAGPEATGSLLEPPVQRVCVTLTLGADGRVDVKLDATLKRQATFNDRDVAMAGAAERAGQPSQAPQASSSGYFEMAEGSARGLPAPQAQKAVSQKGEVALGGGDVEMAEVATEADVPSHARQTASGSNAVEKPEGSGRGNAAPQSQKPVSAGSDVEMADAASRDAEVPKSPKQSRGDGQTQVGGAPVAAGAISGPGQVALADGDVEMADAASFGAGTDAPLSPAKSLANASKSPVCTDAATPNPGDSCKSAPSSDAQHSEGGVGAAQQFSEQPTNGLALGVKGGGAGGGAARHIRDAEIHAECTTVRVEGAGVLTEGAVVRVERTVATLTAASVVDVDRGADALRVRSASVEKAMPPDGPRMRAPVAQNNFKSDGKRLDDPAAKSALGEGSLRKERVGDGASTGAENAGDGGLLGPEEHQSRRGNPQSSTGPATSGAAPADLDSKGASESPAAEHTVDVQAKAQNLEQERANAKDEDRKQEKGKAEESEEEKSKAKDEEQKRLEQAVLDGLGAVADNEEVCAAQQEWLAHPVLRVPEIVLYCQEQDTGVPWKRRMAALRKRSGDIRKRRTTRRLARERAEKERKVAERQRLAAEA